MGETCNGYGRIRFMGELWRAHRLSYMAFNDSDPGGLNVCHLCDVRLCANPDHLWLGTQLENVHDMYAKGRNNHACGERSATAKLTEIDVAEIRSGSVTYIEAMERYGITHSRYYQVKNHKSWKHV